MNDWTLLGSSIAAIITALAGVWIAVSTRRKQAGDTALAFTQAAENIVAMREKDIATLKSEIAQRVLDSEELKRKLTERDADIEELKLKIEAREQDIEGLKRKVNELYRYVEYLHTHISARVKKKVLSLDEFIRVVAKAKTHLEAGL